VKAFSVFTLIPTVPLSFSIVSCFQRIHMENTENRKQIENNVTMLQLKVQEKMKT